MFINKVLNVLHKYTSKVYENSVILKQTDNIIFVAILITFFLSAFACSDIIGYCAIIISLLTVVRIIFIPDDKLEPKTFELFLLAYFMVLLIALAGSSLFHLSLKGFVKTFIYLTFYLSVVHHLKYNKKHIMGLDMLIYQAIRAIEIWTNETPDFNIMKLAAMEHFLALDEVK